MDSPWPTLAPPLDGKAVAGDRVLELGEIVLALDFEGHQVEAHPRGVSQPQRMVVYLVPALQIDRISRPLHFNHADDLGVIGAGKIEVGDGDVDMGQAQDAHSLAPSLRWLCWPDLG